MKTALVIPAIADTPARQKVVQKALDHYAMRRPQWDRFVLHDGFYPLQLSLVHGVIPFPHLGRPKPMEYQYMWRALYFLKAFFEIWEYDKIVFVVDDLFVLSNRLFNYIDNFQNGWMTLWCPRHGFPESGIQVITADCRAYWDFIIVNHPSWRARNGEVMEQRLPFTEVNKSFVGDRYGEYTDKPPPAHLDFYAQLYGEHPIWRSSS